MTNETERDVFIREVINTRSYDQRKGDHVDYTVRHFFTTAPPVDAYAKKHGWPETLRAIAEGLDVTEGSHDE